MNKGKIILNGSKGLLICNEDPPKDHFTHPADVGGATLSFKSSDSDTVLGEFKPSDDQGFYLGLNDVACRPPSETEKKQAEATYKSNEARAQTLFQRLVKGLTTGLKLQDHYCDGAGPVPSFTEFTLNAGGQNYVVVIDGIPQGRYASTGALDYISLVNLRTTQATIFTPSLIRPLKDLIDKNLARQEIRKEQIEKMKAKAAK